MTPLLEARRVSKVFGGGLFDRTSTLALDDFSLAVDANRPSITAVVGESGSGKTTLSRLLLGLTAPTRGEILYEGRDLQTMSRAAWRAGARTLIEDVLRAVGLRPEETLGRFPHQLSGGQRQRVMVARALLLKPRVILSDEPVSMVDASLRATILASLRRMNAELGISIVYVTHDLATAYQISDNIVVLYRGSVAEAGDVELVVKQPRHPYTQLLLSSIPQASAARTWMAETATASAAVHDGTGVGN